MTFQFTAQLALNF